MKPLLVFFFTLLLFPSLGQTPIDSVAYSLSFSDNCYEYQYNLKLPRLRLYAHQKDIRKSINDSLYTYVLPFFAANFPEIVTMYHERNDSSECEVTIYKGPYSFETSFQVLENTDKLLCLVINQLELEGNGGHGGSNSILCYNVDLVNQEFLTFEKLFTESNQNKVLSLLRAEFDKLYKEEGYSFAKDAAHIHFMDISTTQKQLIAHFSVYLGHSSSDIYRVGLPWTLLSKRIKKKYAWLSSVPVKKKKK